jgi:hypothetical protein
VRPIRDLLQSREAPFLIDRWIHRWALSVRRFAALATKGDVASAAWLLKMRAHAKKYGDSGPTIIRVAGGIPEAFR